MMQRIEKKLVLIFSSIIFFISLVTFIFQPFTGDLHVLFAGSHQADYLGGNWLHNAFNVWDLKGVFYRLFLYFFYKIAVPISGFSNYTYEITINAFFCLLVIFTFSLSLIIANGWLWFRRNIESLFLLSSTVFVSLPMAHIQAEMIFVILYILAFAIYENTKRTKEYENIKLVVVGMILGSVFFFKSILVLMSISFVAGLLLWNNYKGYELTIRQFISLVIGGIGMLLIGVGMIFIYNPDEIQNIQNAAAYQSTIFSVVSVSFKVIIFRFLSRFAYACLAIPIILFGVVAGLKNLAENLKNKELLLGFLRLILWGIPSLIVILANCYFTYHYYIFAFVSIIELVLAYRDKYYFHEIRNGKAKLILGICILIIAYMIIKLADIAYQQNLFIVLIALFIILTFMNNLTIRKSQIELNLIAPLIISIVIYISYISIFSDNFKTQQTLTKQMYSINGEILPDINSDEHVLYLDDGLGAYVLGNMTYLDEFYPLPLQRITEGSAYKNSDFYLKAFKKALTYKGRIISVYQNWFFRDSTNIDLYEKIQNEYEKIGEMATYSISENIFKKDDLDDIRWYDIYERK